MVGRWLRSLKQQRRKLMNKAKCVQPCFSMYICAKQAQMEKRSSLVHPRTEKAIGVDLLVPQSRVSEVNDRRSVGITRKPACVPNICVEVRCNVGRWHVQVMCLTLFTDTG